MLNCFIMFTIIIYNQKRPKTLYVYKNFINNHKVNCNYAKVFNIFIYKTTYHKVFFELNT